MFPFATDLAIGDPLLDGDEIARYCSPSRFDRQANKPKLSAFVRKEGQDDLSVNRLQFYVGADRAGSIACIRQEYEADCYKLERNGRFVVLNVSVAKSAALEAECGIDIVYTPDPPYFSHSSINGLPDPPPTSVSDDGYLEELKVAFALVALVTQNDIFLAIPSQG